MTKRVSIEIDADLYAELVRRGGGPRKVSMVANDLIRKGLESEQRETPPDTLTLVRQLQARIEALEKHQGADTTAPSL